MPRLGAKVFCAGLHLLFSLFAVISPATQAIEINIETTSDTVLEDVVLVASAGTSCPRQSVALGDLDLSKGRHVFDFQFTPGLNRWWLMGHSNGEVAYTSISASDGAGLYTLEPYDAADAETYWNPAAIISMLRDYNHARELFSFGVMTDTHYYSEPLGLAHPIQANADPGDFYLKSNITKMESTLDDFAQEDVAFATVLGDLVEDHASWPIDSAYIPNAALVQNLSNLDNLFALYDYPIHLVIGNHDVSYGTLRSSLYSQSTFYAQESYDLGEQAQRFDYIFEVGNIRFIVYDNVQRDSNASRGFRSASPQTLAFLQRELDKVSTGGVDEGKPVVIMGHARADCLTEEGCNQKVDLIDNTSYQWTLSGDGNSEYYLEALGGGDPDLEDESKFQQFLWEDGISMPQEDISALNPGEWNYGNNPVDALDFATVYVRLGSELSPSSGDPDEAAPGHLQFKYVNKGAAENFEDIAPILESAVANGSRIAGVLQGHSHYNRHNYINGVNYYTFNTFKRWPVAQAHAIVDVLADESLSVRGVGSQTSYLSKFLNNDTYDCAQTSSSPWWDLVLNNHASHSAPSNAQASLWRFSGDAQIDSVLHIRLNETLYGDASDGDISGWDIYDQTPFGASVSVAFDSQRQSNVYELTGQQEDNGYRLRNADGSNWDNTIQRTLEFSIRYNEPYTINIHVDTNEGLRYIRYSQSDTNGLGDDKYVDYGLGSDSIDGNWHTFTRDLQADLSAAQPGNLITAVNGFLIRGSGRVDDIKLLSAPPAISDTDGDGLSDADEVDIYGTDPSLADSDADGLLDGEERDYWGGDWNLDNDGDGLPNLLDADADGDGTLDGAEVSAGTDPADPNSAPPTVYEDAEDGTTEGWVVYDASPEGATVTNLFDANRGSRVIAFTGTQLKNGFWLRKASLEDWDNQTQGVLTWSMMFDEAYSLYVSVQTTAGPRYLQYTQDAEHALGDELYAHHGLGSTSIDGNWHTFTRDLQADLSAAQPGNLITAVNGFLVRGSGRLDDIKLLDALPAISDTDGDGLSDADETGIYGTDPSLADSDADGLLDGEERDYWGSNWNLDNDGDGLPNLVDADADGDGTLDGVEVLLGTDPADPNSAPAIGC